MSPLLDKKTNTIITPELSFSKETPVQLELHGSSWQGKMITWWNTGLSIVVDGYIPVTVSQGVTLSFTNRNSFLRISGKVKKLDLWGRNQEEEFPILGQMCVHIESPDLDEFTSFKLRSLLKKQQQQPLFTQISLKFCAEQTDDPLIDVSPQKSTMVKPPIELPEIAKAFHPRLESTLFQCRNGAGKTIIGYHDSQENSHDNAPVIILAPGYGETKREYITLAYFLASNGFHVLRYDHTDHVGESEGSHEYTSLTTMKQDMQAILDYAQQQWKGNKVTLVATSLAGRVALKVLREGYQIDQLILISGIVDVRATLAAVHQEDLIGDYLDGHGRGVTNVLGFNVDGQVFLKDTVEGGYSDLASTILDVQEINAPVVWFSAEQDAWIDKCAHQQVVEALPSQQCRSFVIPEGLHRLLESPRKAKAVYRQIVFACQEQLAWQPKPDELIEPSRKDIGRQNRLERERNQTRRFQHEADHVDFWSHYLANFHYIANSHDYMAALDHIYHLLGPVSPGNRVLDAGCGNGHFGSLLFAKEWTRHQRELRSNQEPIYYFGVDFVETALTQAKIQLAQVLRQADEGHSEATVPSNILHPNFYRLDLNKPLPFQDESFDRIMSNLVIGYLRDPAASIRELLRVLAPGGKLVLTNLKPCSDLTQIYRNFVDRTTVRTAIHEAREVLNNSSHIRQGESEGAFQFYSQEEFRQILSSCGAVNPQVFPTFGNQAYIGIIEKPSLAINEDIASIWSSDALVAA
ncbi:alpha/beta fold hydrolase [Candidatus Nitronereus thalassa]|uniref:Alpha/beta hydrolase n=1 Tax=Candidatus Nitronereus thalassa TaxID=3020898 RepID=A0ABU3K435_9BACT|nr:alpha/beta fold hydrolase [Candidatus Nitronereus thalassa]MDT7041141.1 alpha/beta hydrolase [Candidatus Nitronereus thalassa]